LTKFFVYFSLLGSETFDGRFRDELLNTELFFSIKEAQVLTYAWRREYNECRPHSSPGGQTPAELTQQWIT
jgi:putative transposase